MENYQFTKFMKYSRMKGEVTIGSRTVKYTRDPIPGKGEKARVLSIKEQPNSNSNPRLDGRTRRDRRSAKRTAWAKG